MASSLGKIECCSGSRTPSEAQGLLLSPLFVGGQTSSLDEVRHETATNTSRCCFFTVLCLGWYRSVNRCDPRPWLRACLRPPNCLQWQPSEATLGNRRDRGSAGWSCEEVPHCRIDIHSTGRIRSNIRKPDTPVTGRPENPLDPPTIVPHTHARTHTQAQSM